MGLVLGQPLTYVEQTGSTNADATMAANAGATHGSLFVANEQVQGRGRMGKAWLSPKGQNLAFSLVLRPDMPVDRLPAITLAVGLAIAEAISGFVDTQVGLKWPNDVILGSRKVAGILVEAALSGNRCEHLVAGIGINVRQVDFDPSIELLATSLARELPEAPARAEVLLACLSCLTRRLDQFEAEGLVGMMGELSARDVTKGRRVRVGEEQGVADGIEEDGRLRVRIEGALRRLHAGDVEVLR